MVDDPNLFGFGCFLALGSIALILSLRGAEAKRPIRAISQIQEPSSEAESSDAERVKALEQHCLQLCEELRMLNQQCLRLRDELQQQKLQLTDDFRVSTFESLQSLLANYPTAQKMAQVKPDLPAKNLTALFTPLENLLTSWSIQPIGTAWEQVPYHPEWHQPDTDDLTLDEPVYIRFVGYRDGDRILLPAKVSRTLPPLAQ
jgi:hypothetical protein